MDERAETLGETLTRRRMERDMYNSTTIQARPEVVFEDVQLDIDPFDLEIGEIEDITEFDSLSKEIAKSISAKSAEEKVYQEYEQFYTSTMKKLEVMLEYHFPNRWFVQNVNPLSTVKQYFRNGVSLATFLSGSQGGTDRMYDRILIHFPLITISNGRRSHLIKDLYVILEFNYRLSLVGGLRCFRTTKTVREYKCHYNHSHAKKINNDTAHFCLGATPLDTLVAEISTRTFSELNYDLLFQQLPDYLAWESLDGGPYIRMDELFKTQMGQPQVPLLSSIYSEQALSALLKKRPKLDFITNAQNGRVTSVTVCTTIELWKEITKYSSPSLRFPHIEGTWNSVYPSNGGDMTNREIERINDDIGESRLVYKGQNLRLQIELNTSTTAEAPQVELLADSRILQYVTAELSARLTKHLNDVYWYGIKCNTKESDIPTN